MHRSTRHLPHVVLCTVVLLLAGCATTSNVPHSNRDYALLNRKLENRRVVIRFRDQTRQQATNVRVGADSVAWPSAVDRRIVHAPTSSVECVEIVRRGKGARVGALAAFLAVGTAVGIVAAVDVADNDWGDMNTLKPFFGVGIGGIYGAMAAVPGAVVGLVVGHRSCLPVGNAPAP